MSRILRSPRCTVLHPEALATRSEIATARLEARAAATEILARAEAEADALRSDARKNGREQASAEAAALLQQAHEAKAQFLMDAQADVMRLSVAVAAKLVGTELTTSPEHIRFIIGDAIALVRRASRLRVRLSPLDAEAARQLSELQGLEIADDETLERGDCIVESDIGSVDHRLSVRTERLLQALQAKK